MSQRLFVGLQIYGDQAINLAAMSAVMRTAAAAHGDADKLWEPDGSGYRSGLGSSGLNTIPYHITLRFLGSVDCSRIRELQDALAAVAAATPVFSLRLDQTGTFPGRDTTLPRVAWVGVDGDRERLDLLQAAVNEHFDGLGYPPADYVGSFHVTVGRLDTADAACCRELAAFWRSMPCRRTGAFLVDHLALYVSERDDQGLTTYVIRDRWALTPDPALYVGGA